ncbi:hypothetical protein TrLO_g10884 [Triparma laevis f. longispina]|uniref:Uncharacterized protein n=1 Tax=Triparma laevis f. longispina TaxID=1714387 RepID=A0A9W7C941_9STRA|nr:hypothetical protein TrLO_g10884 [Triparma laevis f. longispina]
MGMCGSISVSEPVSRAEPQTPTSPPEFIIKGIDDAEGFRFAQFTGEADCYWYDPVRYEKKNRTKWGRLGPDNQAVFQWKSGNHWSGAIDLEAGTAQFVNKYGNFNRFWWHGWSQTGGPLQSPYVNLGSGMPYTKEIPVAVSVPVKPALLPADLEWGAPPVFDPAAARGVVIGEPIYDAPPPYVVDISKAQNI